MAVAAAVAAEAEAGDCAARLEANLPEAFLRRLCTELRLRSCC